MNEVRRNKGTPTTPAAGNDFASGTEFLGEWIVTRTHYLDKSYAMEESGGAAETESTAATEEGAGQGGGK
jgi:hypothetical protein